MSLVDVPSDLSTHVPEERRALASRALTPGYIRAHREPVPRLLEPRIAA